MNVLQVGAFLVSGSHVRTNNKLEAGDSAKLPGLWKQFYASHPKPDSGVYDVYSNYESDMSGDFTVTAGTKSGRRIQFQCCNRIQILRLDGLPRIFLSPCHPPLRVVLTADCVGKSNGERRILSSATLRAVPGELRVLFAARRSPVRSPVSDLA